MNNINLKNLIFLAQSDTTIGFLSKNANRINEIKKASQHKILLKEFAYFKNLDSRIPPRFRQHVRQAKKTTFILPNNRSFRVIKDKQHRFFLESFEWFYSSSANLSGQNYNKGFAMKNADIIVQDYRGLIPKKSSKICKINNFRMQKIR